MKPAGSAFVTFISEREKMKRVGLAISLALFVCALLCSCAGNPHLTGAKVYIQQQDWVQAQRELEIAVQDLPQDAEVHYWLGKVYGEQGMYEAMVKEFQTSLDISDKWKERIEAIREEKWGTVFNLGLKAWNEEDSETAIENFKMATMIDPQKPESFLNLGFAYQSQERYDEALKAYYRVFELQPENLPVKVSAGSIYLNRGEFDKALDLFQKILEQDPTQKDALWRLTLTYERMAQERKADLESADTHDDSLRINEEVRSILDQAIVVYNQAIEAYPEEKDFYYYLGILYFRDLQNYHAAVPLFQKAAELDPNDVNIWYNLATAQLALDDLEGAQPSLERVIELEPENSMAWYQLGIIYIKKGMKSEGEEAFKKAEELRGEEE